MRWTITLECSREDGTTSVAEVATIERGRCSTAGDVGLQLVEAKRVNARLQELVMTEQLRQHCAGVRRCAACEQRRALKDYRLRRIDTVLGRVVVRAPRFRACRCVGAKALLCPVSELLPTRTTPELRHLQVTLGANLSYRRAASLLREFLPDATCFNHATTRNRVAAVGKAIDAELRAEIAAANAPTAPVDTMIVGIDGCYVKGLTTRRKSSLEIVLGRVEAPERASEMFAVVRRLDGLAKERVRAVLRRCGRGPQTKVVVLSDGEDGMRSMLGRWLDPTVEHRLDWWHLYRRLEKMRDGLVYLPSATDAEWHHRLRVEAAAIEHLRWTLWNGCECVYAADCAITDLRLELMARARAVPAAGQGVARIQDMLDQLADFRRYMYANAPSLINYNIARIDGERVSTAHIESTVNSLVNWRMSKKQQMRWSPLGAQHLLHVRTAILNGRLHRYTGLPVKTDATTTVASPTRVAA
jgi:hypothetical protein